MKRIDRRSIATPPAVSEVQAERWAALFEKGVEKFGAWQKEQGDDLASVAIALANAIRDHDEAGLKGAAAALADFEYEVAGDCEVFFSDLFDELRHRGLYTEDDDQEHVFAASRFAERPR